MTYDVERCELGTCPHPVQDCEACGHWKIIKDAGGALPAGYVPEDIVDEDIEGEE